MKRLPGVFEAQKKDGSIYYRASITFRSKHISLGSFPTELQAGQAYKEAKLLLGTENRYGIYQIHCPDP